MEDAVGIGSTWPTPIYSILKKGKIRKDRIKKLKSHNDYHKMIQNMKLEFREIDT